MDVDVISVEPNPFLQSNNPTLAFLHPFSTLSPHSGRSECNTKLEAIAGLLHGLLDIVDVRKRDVLGVGAAKKLVYEDTERGVWHVRGR